MGVKSSNSVFESRLGRENEMVGIVADEDLNLNFFLESDFDLVNFQ